MASSIQKKQILETNSARFLSSDEVEIGRLDSNVMITADQWGTAKNKNTFIVAGLSLPTAVFDSDALLQRNLKGSCNKINKDAARNKAIDADKLSAIKYTVRQLYSTKCNEKLFHTAVNSKLTRRYQRKNDCSDLTDFEISYDSH